MREGICTCVLLSFLCLFVFISEIVFMYLYLCICICFSVFVYLYLCICICFSVNVYLFLFICIYVFAVPYVGADCRFSLKEGQGGQTSGRPTIVLPPHSQHHVNHAISTANPIVRFLDPSMIFIFILYNTY